MVASPLPPFSSTHIVHQHHHCDIISYEWSLFCSCCLVYLLTVFAGPHKFLTSKQSSRQKFNDFVTVLCQRAADCEYVNLTDPLVKDILVVGTNNLRLKKCLLRKHDITLDQAIQAGQAVEGTRN